MISWHKICTLDQLKTAAENRQSVVVPSSHPWSKPKPAAFLLHQQGVSLLRLFDLGMFVYSKKKKGIL